MRPTAPGHSGSQGPLGLVTMCVCVCTCVCGQVCLGSCMCISEGPNRRSCLAGCGVPRLRTPLGCEAPPRPPAPGSSPESRPSRSLRPCFRSLGGLTDGQMGGWRATPAFLPSSVHSFLLGSGLGSELPAVVIKPLTRRPPRFAAMIFNTSGMIRNLKQTVGGYAGLQDVGAGPAPCRGPCPAGRGGRHDAP